LFANDFELSHQGGRKTEFRAELSNVSERRINQHQSKSGAMIEAAGSYGSEGSED
jgi:hypothetical protein